MIDGGRLAGHDVRTGRTTSPDDVVGELDRLGITRAFVGSWRCLHQDVRRGNAEAAAWAAASGDRLLPLAIVQPSRYGETPDALIGEAATAGARAVVVHGADWLAAGEWASPAVRAIGEAAVRAGLPLQAVISSAAELAQVGGSWGGLGCPVLVRWTGGHRYRWLAAELAAAGRWPSLHFDVGTVCSAGALQLLADRIGSDRLFFASNAPTTVAAATVGTLVSSGVAAAADADIRDRTLRRVFGLGPGAAGPTTPAGLQALFESAKLDTHWHHDHWNLGEPGMSRPAQEALRERFGITTAVVSSVLAITYDVVEGNASAAAWCDSSSWRALIVVNPRQPAASIGQLERWADDERFIGAKTIQDTYGLSLDDDLYRPLLEEIERRGLPLMCHLPGVEAAAARHPGLQFLAAHANFGRASRLAHLPNVSFDFTTSHADAVETQLRAFLDAVGAHRVVFGSDAPLVSPAWSLGKLADAGVAESELPAILGENARRLFPRLR